MSALGTGQRLGFERVAPQGRKLGIRWAGLAGLVLLAGLAGCNSGSSGGSANHPAANAAGGALKKPVDGLVAALGLPKTPPGLPLQVKFELRSHPEPGQPVELDLVIVPTSAIVERVSGRVEGDDGLEVVEGAQLSPSDRPVVGVPIHHALKLQPQRDGIFLFSALLTVDSGPTSTTETYTMPLIAGKGMPDLPAQPPAPPKTAGSAGVPGAPAPAATAASTTH